MKSILRVLLIFAIYFTVFPSLDKQSEVKAQSSVNISQSSPTSNSTSVAEFSVLYSSDSLLEGKTNSISVLPYADYLASFSFYATGSAVKNFRVNAYLSNYLTTDTTYWTLMQGWDTTGLYTGKPINDTVLVKWNGLPMRYLYFKVKGLAGNGEDVVFYGRVSMIRKQ